MAAVSAPYGLRPVRSLSSGGYQSGNTRQYKMTNSYGTSVFYGDVVTLAATGTVEKSTATTTTLAAIGVFLGCTYTDPSLNYKIHSNMWTASTSATDIMAYVCDDPFMIYQAQADGDFVQSDLGNNCAVVQTAGNANIGMSKVTLSASSAATTNTLPLRIVGFVDGPDSTLGDGFTDALVMFNFGDHQLLQDTGTGT